MVPGPNGSSHCPQCDFLIFMNVATAVGAFIADGQGRLLLLRRSHNPGKGMLAAPGGFVDPAESAEEALAREVREEVNLEVASARYFCSFPNRYDYRGVIYPTADFYFLCTVKSLEPLTALDEVESCCFLRPDEINLEDLAFITLRQAMKRYLAGPR